MKKEILSGLLLLAAAAPLYCAPALEIKGESKYEWRTADPKDQEFILWEDGGVSGRCFRMTCPAEREYLLCHTWSQPQIPVASPQDRVKMTIFLKGKGSGKFGFLARNENHGGLSISETMEDFEVNSPDKWVKREFVFYPEVGPGYQEKCRFLLPVVRLQSGGNIQMDDFTFEFVSPRK